MIPCDPAGATPAYTEMERRVDACLHVAGIIAACATAGALLVVAAPIGSIGIPVYGASLVITLTCSALYNLAAPSVRKERLRRLDHAAIYLLIAGTCTPFLLHLELRLLCLGLWLVAGAGAILKLSLPRRFERTAIALYLAMGWIVVAAILPGRAGLPEGALALLVAGGLLYSIGVPFHLATRLRFHNAIWHGFVLAAAMVHALAVLRVASPG